MIWKAALQHMTLLTLGEYLGVWKDYSRVGTCNSDINVIYLDRFSRWLDRFEPIEDEL